MIRYALYMVYFTVLLIYLQTDNRHVSCLCLSSHASVATLLTSGELDIELAGALSNNAL